MGTGSVMVLRAGRELSCRSTNSLQDPRPCSPARAGPRVAVSSVVVGMNDGTTPAVTCRRSMVVVWETARSYEATGVVLLPGAVAPAVMPGTLIRRVTAA